MVEGDGFASDFGFWIFGHSRQNYLPLALYCLDLLSPLVSFQFVIVVYSTATAQHSVHCSIQSVAVLVLLMLYNRNRDTSLELYEIIFDQVLDYFIHGNGANLLQCHILSSCQTLFCNKLQVELSGSLCERTYCQD